MKFLPDHQILHKKGIMMLLAGAKSDQILSEITMEITQENNRIYNLPDKNTKGTVSHTLCSI
jgi:hypothetical protein